MSDSKFKDELVFVIRSINEYLIAFFRGQVLVAICDGIMYAIGFLIIQLPYAILIGAAAIVLTIIPFLGAIIICVVSLIIAIVNNLLNLMNVSPYTQGIAKGLIILIAIALYKRRSE